MFRVAVFLAAVLGAVAFSPVARVARSSAVKMSFESEIGAQPPLGFWDPLGLLTDADADRFERLRTVETKHGRIAQLAILGHIVTTAGYRLPTSLTPGYDLSTVGSGLKALTDLPVEAIFGTLLTVAVIEGGYAARKEEIEEAQLKASGWDEETINRKLAIELNNDPYIINTLLGQPVAFN